MAELLLPQEQTLALRASAHRLAPVVLMGAAGLSAAVLQEIDRALRAHGLVKIRGGKSERDERDALFLAMADTLAAARVQVIGNTFVLFRPIPASAPPPRAPAGKAPAGKARAAKAPPARTRAVKAPARVRGAAAGEAGRRPPAGRARGASAPRSRTGGGARGR